MAGAAENTAAVIVVNQRPPSIRAMEGSEFTIECTFYASNNSFKWFAEWNKTRNNVTAKVNNGTDRIILSTDREKRSLSLTVKKADVTDSGTYVCGVGSKNGTSPGTGTQVTIDEITDLMVNQTPTSVSDLEGSELTMNCTFKTVNNHSTMYVRWYNYGTEGLKQELVKESEVITTLHLDNGFASLTLKNVNSSNTGTYVCEVGITARNLSGNGTGTQVTIEKLPKLMVNQTPANIHESEGSVLTMECRFTELKNHRTLYVKWYKHNGTGATKKELMSERGGGSAALDLEKGFASFTLKNVNVTDTGTYVCEVGSTARNWSASGAGTQVTITPVDLLVTQSPAFVNEEEGKQLTIECRFRALEKPSAKYSVKWYKNGTDGHEQELKNGTGSVTTILDFSAGLASLNLTKVSMSDSGFYRCDFGKNGRGNGTRVTIHDKRRNASHVLFIIRMVLGALVIILAVIIITECVISEKRAAVSQTI
ncbi:polymeric immunoglobulin receptor-like [Mauremys mutica]|uniref:polymeric immunoglobulin receptor-like n=1 Tax=Mauremys mutica TaxID=74926 RepID=UPI001D161171|nr:polymeric immunoglobulin receptor-like [Mauremys mutica]